MSVRSNKLATRINFKEMKIKIETFPEQRLDISPTSYRYPQIYESNVQPFCITRHPVNMTSPSVPVVGHFLTSDQLLLLSLSVDTEISFVLLPLSVQLSTTRSYTLSCLYSLHNQFQPDCFIHFSIAMAFQCPINFLHFTIFAFKFFLLTRI
jgi:hypothetical protein